MRSNGLTAASYTPVADLDPRVADALLTELKVQGVAAYTKPVESTSASGFDRPEYRVNVLDRLYVDAAESDRVTSMIAEQDPALVVDNDDLTWAQIVAGFDQPVTDDVPRWPTAEDVDRPEPEAAGRPDDESGASTATSTDDPRTDLRRWLSGRNATGSATDPRDASSDSSSASEDGSTDPDGQMRIRDDPRSSQDSADRFVPPPPPPLPQLEPWQQVAWVGLVGGPLLLVVAVMFSIHLPTWVSLAAVVGFIGGFIALVATMDDRGDSDDDSDNGAVV